MVVLLWLIRGAPHGPTSALPPPAEQPRPPSLSFPSTRIRPAVMVVLRSRQNGAWGTALGEWAGEVPLPKVSKPFLQRSGGASSLCSPSPLSTPGGSDILGATPVVIECL